MLEIWDAIGLLSLECHWSQTEIARITLYLVPYDWVELTFMNSLSHKRIWLFMGLKLETKHDDFI